jgi:hypothetical protein
MKSPSKISKNRGLSKMEQLKKDKIILLRGIG